MPMASANTIASETPGYLRIMRIPSFTSSDENASFHCLSVIARGAYYRELYVVKKIDSFPGRGVPHRQAHEEYVPAHGPHAGGRVARTNDLDEVIRPLPLRLVEGMGTTGAKNPREGGR